MLCFPTAHKIPLPVIAAPPILMASLTGSQAVGGMGNSLQSLYMTRADQKPDPATIRLDAWSTSQKFKKEKVETFPDIFASSKKVLEGLRSVQIVTGTSGGVVRNLDLARQLFRASWLYRHDIFSLEQKTELEQLIRTSKALKVGMARESLWRC